MARYHGGGGYHHLVGGGGQDPHSIVVHDHDVLSGRGVNIAHHPGNQRFRTLVTTKADTNYCSAYSTTEKKKAAEEVIRHIQSLRPPGRFLRREGRANNSRGLQGPWYTLSEKEVLKKTTQALRDCNRQDRTGYAVGVAVPDDVKQAVERRQQNQQLQRTVSDAGGGLGLVPVQGFGGEPAHSTSPFGNNSLSRKRSLSPSVEQGAALLKNQRTGIIDMRSTSTSSAQQQQQLTLSPAVGQHVSTVTPAGSAEHGSTGSSDGTTVISAIGAPPAPPLAGVNYSSQPSLAMAPAPPTVLVYQQSGSASRSNNGAPSPHGSYSSVGGGGAPGPVSPAQQQTSIYGMEQRHLAQDLVHMATSSAVPPPPPPPGQTTQLIYAPPPPGAAYTTTPRSAPVGGGSTPYMYVQAPSPTPYAIHGGGAPPPTGMYVANPLGGGGRTSAPSTPRELHHHHHHHVVPYSAPPVIGTSSPMSPARTTTTIPTSSSSFHHHHHHPAVYGGGPPNRPAPPAPPMPSYQPIAPMCASTSGTPAPPPAPLSYGTTPVPQQQHQVHNLATGSCSPPAPSPYASATAPVTATSTTTTPGGRLVHHDHSANTRSKSSPPPLPDTPSPAPGPDHGMQHYDYGMNSSDDGGGHDGDDPYGVLPGSTTQGGISGNSSTGDPLADLITVGESVRDHHHHHHHGNNDDYSFHIGTTTTATSGGRSGDDDDATDVSAVF
eukprot:CAMPEP_0194036540 /NCGR_PEP_ID=MMETSP0009_2-20130614/8899_1 /TAXON_ID=210454 /ORGANISM="Grammatophora oceanica, Strain CCMP 410" /LENGTH=714 /DNA_ID=CAMNT_0038678343 /DNA_START=287 /DNA_END=2431 /DNA_ORIENTATION=+